MEQTGKLDALSKNHLPILAERIGSPHFDILAERCFRGESIRKIKKFAAKLDSCLLNNFIHLLGNYSWHRINREASGGGSARHLA